MFTQCDSSYLNEHDEAFLKEHYGGKGAGLIRMHGLGLPIPPAVVAPVSYSREYQFDRSWTLRMVRDNIGSVISTLEYQTGKKFGAANSRNEPLLLSVRSGAPVSMPGMMDTVLNVGLNDKSVKVLAQFSTPEFAWDTYRRFVQSYASIVLEMDKAPFEELVSASRHFFPGTTPSVKMSMHLIEKFFDIYHKNLYTFPQDVWKQLSESIEAVFRSYNSKRAVAYRNAENIDHSIGTAVIVQAMVFGNLNENSGTGVLFTRNPTTGTSERYGDFLANAQGEDVVDGSHQTTPYSHIKTLPQFTEVAEQLESYAKKLETLYGDMCDIEFTIESGKLYVLQVRPGKRTTTASKRIPLEMLADGTINVDQAAALIDKIEFGGSSQGMVTNVDGFAFIGSGEVACDGDAEGILALSSESAVAMAESGKTPILVTNQTDPNDMPGIKAAAGILTLTGGLVSHAAVVARSWNKPCIVGAGKTLHQATIEPGVCFRPFGLNGDSFYEGDHIILRPSEGGKFYMKKASVESNK